MDFQDKCPMCNINGRLWDKEDEIFQCPNCSTLFSRFGLLLDNHKNPEQEFWS